ncbi:MAG TPA: oxidoreductase [Pyrinomonadaceae bacterium]|nr:oxidoreductase [Pyrinomonadaceae bacterium]
MNTLQKPIGSGFEAASTSKDVIKGIDLSGKNVVVTGGYVGLGLETTKTLVAAGARVIVPARSREKAVNYLEGVENVEIETMDLMDPDSIDAFAERFLAKNEPLHLLINNAGIMATPLNRDSRGNESQFATNHLGHFQLTNRLWSALQKAGGARIVNLSSRGHHFSPFIFDDPNFEQNEYNPWIAYGQSKTANILFTVSLDERGKDENIRAFAVHPGGILDTELSRHLDLEDPIFKGFFDENGKPILDPVNGLKTIEQGAATQIWAATNPKLENLGGVYAEDCEIANVTPENNETDSNIAEVVRKKGVMPYAIDKENADKLWTLSEKLVG